MIKKLDQEIDILLKKYGIEKAETHTSFFGLEKYSICKCENCQHLMVNRDKNPAGFSGKKLANEMDSIIYDGGEHNGKILYEECLPVTHRWRLHSSSDKNMAFLPTSIWPRKSRENNAP